MDSDDADVFRDAYLTTTPDPDPDKKTVFRNDAGNITALRQPSVDSSLQWWVCPNCFDEFKDELLFSIEGK